MANTVTTKTDNEYILTRYYEKVAEESVDRQIRDQVIEVANKIADDIISQYKLKKLIKQELPHVGLTGKKITIAVQFEKVK